MNQLIRSGYNGLGSLCFVLALLFLGTTACQASSSAVTHSVTAVVPSILSLTTSTGAMAFNFSDYLSGTDSAVVTGSYTVKANTMTTTGHIDAVLSAPITGMDFKADPQSYSSTSGSAGFSEAYSGYSTVAGTAVKMYNQSGGASAATANGTFTVNYKFTATTDLAANTYGPVTLSVTLYNT